MWRNVFAVAIDKVGALRVAIVAPLVARKEHGEQTVWEGCRGASQCLQQRAHTRTTHVEEHNLGSTRTIANTH